MLSAGSALVRVWASPWKVVWWRQHVNRVRLGVCCSLAFEVDRHCWASKVNEHRWCKGQRTSFNLRPTIFKGQWTPLVQASVHGRCLHMSTGHVRCLHHRSSRLFCKRQTSAASRSARPQGFNRWRTSNGWSPICNCQQWPNSEDVGREEDCQIQTSCSPLPHACSHFCILCSSLASHSGDNMQWQSPPLLEPTVHRFETCSGEAQQQHRPIHHEFPRSLGSELLGCPDRKHEQEIGCLWHER